MSNNTQAHQAKMLAKAERNRTMTTGFTPSPRTSLRHMRRVGEEALPGSVQPTAMLADGGYRTLTPTKGWRRYTARRLAAQMKMATMLDHTVAPGQNKPSRSDDPAYRKSIWPAPKAAVATLRPYAGPQA